MLFCCLWRNVETSYHKHFVVVSRHQQTLPLTISHKCHNFPPSGGTVLITPGGHSVDSMRWSQKLAQNRDFCLLCLHSTLPLGGGSSEYCHDVWYGKTRMVWIPMVKKNWKIHFFYSLRQNTWTWQTDGRTDRRTPHDGIGRACIASH